MAPTSFHIVPKMATLCLSDFLILKSCQNYLVIQHISFWWSLWSLHCSFSLVLSNLLLLSFCSHFSIFLLRAAIGVELHCQGAIGNASFEMFCQKSTCFFCITPARFVVNRTASDVSPRLTCQIVSRRQRHKNLIFRCYESSIPSDSSLILPSDSQSV